MGLCLQSVWLPWPLAHINARPSESPACGMQPHRPSSSRSWMSGHASSNAKHPPGFPQIRTKPLRDFTKETELRTYQNYYKYPLKLENRVRLEPHWDSLCTNSPKIQQNQTHYMPFQYTFLLPALGQI